MGNQTSSENTLTRFVKSSGIFLIGTVSSKVIVFFMLPVYTKFIKPVDYGYYDLSTTYIALLSGILFFDVWSSMMRFMYDSRKLDGKYKAVGSAWVIFGGSAIVYVIVGIIIASTLGIRYVGLIFLYGLSNNISSMYDFTSRGLGKNRQFAISGVLCTLTNVFTNLILLVLWHWDFSSLYIAFILGNLVQAAYLEANVHLLKHARWKILDFSLIKTMLRYTMPLCINSVSYWLLYSFDRLVINHMMGTAANGYFAIGDKFGAMIALVTTCFTYAWQEMSFAHAANKGNDGAFFAKACNTYMKFLGAGAAILISACYIIFPLMVNKSYEAAKVTIPLFLLVGLISALSTFIGNVFYAIKDTKTIFTSMVASCLLNLALCFPLIHAFGLNGANISIFLSFLLNIIIRNFILRKKIGFRLNLRIVLLLLVWIGLSSVIYAKGNLWINMAWFVFSLVYACFIFRDMIKALMMGLKKKGI